MYLEKSIIPDNLKEEVGNIPASCIVPGREYISLQQAKSLCKEARTALESILEIHCAAIASVLQEMGVKNWGMDSISPSYASPIVDITALNEGETADGKTTRRVTPISPTLNLDQFKDAKEGDVLLRGVLHYAELGVRPGLELNSYYIRTNDGRDFFDNDIPEKSPTEIPLGTRVQMIKTKDGIILKAVKAA